MRLEGRRLWFVGIGGAGLSGYALVAKAWGAEVAGWDRHETPYLEYVRAAGIPVTISDEIAPAPDGYESVVSTAYLSEGQTLGPVSKSRAEFLAELVSLQDSIVVSGAHGKTTTTGMIAFALERAGRDPSFLIGGEIPQLGGNARAGSGWLVVEGDESDRTVERLRPQIAVVTNVDLDHHSEFASRAEVEDLFERWLADVPHVVRADELEPVDFELAVPGEHNRRNAAAALAALELAGLPREEAQIHLAEFSGAGRRLELRGEAGGVRVLDDYAHHPAEIRATIEAVRDGRSRPRPVPAAPLLAHAPPRSGPRRRARLRRCGRGDRDLSRAREPGGRRERQARRRRARRGATGDDDRLDAGASRTEPASSRGAHGPATSS